MRKLLFTVALVASFATFTHAQDTDSRGEFFAGYSLLRTDVSAEDFRSFGDSNDEPFKNLNGVNVAATGYFSERVGITGDFSAHFKSARDEFLTGIQCVRAPCPSSLNAEIKARSFNFLGGPQVRFANNTRVTPFVRALAGVQHNRLEFDETSGGVGSFETSQTDFVLGLGGGLDIGVSDSVAIRAFQVDYNPVFMRDTAITFGGISQRIEGERTDNVRFSVATGY